MTGPVIDVPDRTDELLPFLLDLYPAEECVQAIARGDVVQANRVAIIREFVQEIKQLREDAEAAARESRSNS